ncbi:ABC transporter ATP-binding protein [Ureibacillus manganicus]|uniref:ABC transporter ATP-binding protein n=1 Tax=Ureibacillus manganicus DSM 26584 TaxID=1384049 RepID=A0A0A3I8V9_9BACL|nr:ABC transporter ATP-binding protein [Ureibacillus manganicus]KGR79925.1 ABC transporter ATP-binding protein [Ureibacillus manganicus DSM 26584]
MVSKYIHVNELYKSFDQQVVLQNVNFQVKKGEIIGLIGPNGAGKTTFIRILNGVIKADRGSIVIAGLDPVKDGDDIRKKSGIVTESAGLYHQMSGEENLRFFSDLYGVQNKNRIIELLMLFDLIDHKDKQVGKYSTGMKKRLALAKALLHKPDILFLDEPTNGLDPDGIKLVLSYLKKYNEETGTTMIICSHVLHQLETVCQSFAFIDHGTIVEQGTVPELAQKYIDVLKVEVETTLKPITPKYQGYNYTVDGNKLIFELPSKQEISKLLNEILKTDEVFSVTTLNTDLESIYFKVRENGHDK